MSGQPRSAPMCGFTGIIDTGTSKRSAEICAVVRAMTEPLSRRGPDDAGTWIDEGARVALGFRRLAILDLSDAGHQPMVSRDGQLAIVFNGEIYNHAELRAEVSRDRETRAWTGHSDTETLLECFTAWGLAKTLERAVGMFSLALWDRAARRLYLARDRFGEKPLYYGWTRGAFVFGSELSALRQYPGFDNAIDRNALALYAEYACVPAPYSIYEHIYKLEPACVLALPLAAAERAPSDAPFAPARGAFTIERYWSLADVARRGMSDPLRDEYEAIAQLETALAEAVRLQSIADVPLGAFLSGGIDSSAVVALMQSQSSRRVKTFTIGFEEAGFNEAAHAKAIASHLGTEHEELYVRPQEARDVIPDLPHLYAEPFADASQIPTHLVSRIARRHVTVALSGDGGDELFGGYTRYSWIPRIWNRIQVLPAPLRRALGGAIQQLPVPVWDALGRGVSSRLGTMRLGDKAHKLAHRLQHVSDLDDLYRSLVTLWPNGTAIVNGAQRAATPLDRAIADGSIREPAHRMMLWDALTYLPDDILHKVDRASMGVSLETRAPFLDHRVAELAWRLPLDMKIRNGSGKWILRQVLYRHVPKELIERPKMGFGVPIETWLRGPLRAWAEDLLDESRLRREGFFQPEPIRRKWAEHLSGRRNWQNELWCVLMFQAWHAAESR